MSEKLQGDSLMPRSRTKSNRYRARQTLRGQMAKLYVLARSIRSEEQLTSILLDTPNKYIRRAIYDQLRPMLHPSLAGYVYEGTVADHHVTEC